MRLQRTPRAKTPNNPVRLVVGLRNPGSAYEGTRHNIGFEVVSRSVDRAGGKLGRAPLRLRSVIASAGVGESRVVFSSPNTFMNESGGAVRAVLGYYKVGVGAILVVHDDIDLGFGRLRLQVGGGSGGHNGIRSIEESLGTKDFSRLKIGVGRPPRSMDPADYVLRPFARSERSEVDLMVADAVGVVELWLTDPARAQELAALRGRDEPGSQG